jgi:hypothetical protein
VKLDKIFRQVRRDLTASPKKAAALGLMILVALYFWVPMVWGWIAPEANAGKQVVDASEVILEDDPVDPVTTAKKSGKVFAWEKVRRKVAADPRMTPALYEVTWSDPFPLVHDDAKAGAAQTTAGLAQASAPVDPAALGLKLTSVAIGAKSRSAIINGEKYREGESVPAEGSDTQSGSGVAFRVTHIGFREVELEYQGRTYTLELSRPRLAPGDALNRTR